ncbi:DUF4843 domain-containing protein [Solitalea koreensis]|uniref:DUF4843 domain-containing protein n=1 Tax=Solitalea koreensis TaxID=543615 RepID=A0A521AVH5_9SPHI|nr:DUF4843 domain-containing protein [Solitalea koreensis]SMO38836.1 protein of unknown function [Solitalea koreensis]
MKKLIYKIALLFMAVALVSCEKGLMTFDNENTDVYFYGAGGTSSVNFDESYVSFQFVTKPDTILNVVVSITGAAADHDREYKLAVGQLSNEELLYDDDNNPATPPTSMVAAIQGTHFELPEKFVIKKGAFRDTVKLKLLRSPDLLNKRLALAIELQPNENFGNSFKSRIIGGKPINTIRTKIFFDDKDAKPKYWLDAAFSTYSREKLFFLCNMFNLSPRYFDSPNDISELNGYGKFAQRHLNELAAAGTPVYEKNGTTRMVMGPNAQ